MMCHEIVYIYPFVPDAFVVLLLIVMKYSAEVMPWMTQEYDSGSN